MKPEAANLSDVHLAASVQTMIAGKRIGTPVFVRMLLQGPDSGDVLLAKLNRLIGVAQEWLGRPLVRYQATGSLEAGQVSLALSFAGGSSALVAYARGSVIGDGLDMMVLGNHGAIYHDGGSASVSETPLIMTPEVQGPLSVAALRHALELRRPMTLKEGVPS